VLLRSGISEKHLTQSRLRPVSPFSYVGQGRKGKADRNSRERAQSSQKEQITEGHRGTKEDEDELGAGAKLSDLVSLCETPYRVDVRIGEPSANCRRRTLRLLAVSGQ
jgi:hypothetical protein